jgi:hypothetical protein
LQQNKLRFLKSQKGKEVGGGKLRAKCQSSKFEIPVNMEKGALSVNYIFSTTTSGLRAGKTQFWVKGELKTRIVEKICLSGEERVFSRRQAKGGRREEVC